MTTTHRERLRSSVGGGLRPAPQRKVPFRANSRWFPNASPTPCRGGPMCPPAPSSRDPPTGRHTGRPLQIQLQPSSTPENRAGAEPRPYSRRTPKTASRSTRPPQTSSPTTQNALHDRRHPALGLRPSSQRKKHPRPSPNRGFQRGPRPPLVVSRRVWEDITGLPPQTSTAFAVGKGGAAE